MSAIKANWFTDVAEADVAGDPLGPPAPSVERVGRRVEVDGEAKIAERYTAALDREAALDERGVTCAIKDDPQASCSACPLRHVDPLDALTPLCVVGVEQESLITRLRILRIHESAREAEAT